MKYILVTVQLLTFVALIGGCGGDNDGDGEFVDYCPFAIGNVWDYLWTTAVEMQDTSFTVTGDIRLEIIGDTTLVNGMDVFMQEIFNSMPGWGTARDTFYIAETDTSILRYDSVNDTVPYKLLELPLEENNSWTPSANQIAIVLGRSNVSVPAGDYQNCWEIVYTDGYDSVYDYYGAYTGLVKEYMFDSGGGVTMTTAVELESATIQ